MKIAANLLGVILMAVLNTASAGGCATASSRGTDGSASVARLLIDHVAPYWDIAYKKKPDSASVSSADDPSGDGEKLAYHSVRFKHFRASFYLYPDGTPLPSELSTASAAFKLPCGLKIGQSHAAVKTRLGPPTNVRDGADMYATGGDLNAEVALIFQHGRLRHVAWTYAPH